MLFGVGHPGRAESVLGSTETVELLVAIADHDLDGALPLHQVGDHRVYVLALIEQDGAEAVGQVRAAHLAELEIAVVGDLPAGVPQVDHALPDANGQPHYLGDAPLLQRRQARPS